MRREGRPPSGVLSIFPLCCDARVMLPARPPTLCLWVTRESVSPLCPLVMCPHQLRSAERGQAGRGPRGRGPTGRGPVFNSGPVFPRDRSDQTDQRVHAVSNPVFPAVTTVPFKEPAHVSHVTTWSRGNRRLLPCWWSKVGEELTSGSLPKCPEADQGLPVCPRETRPRACPSRLSRDGQTNPWKQS